MEGIIIVNKPSGWTSFDVVAKIRSLTRVKKVGHSGTLDPMATGVLPVFLGRATKSIQYFMDGDKGYLAEMTLGIETDTGDAYGKVIDQPSPPIPLSLRERGRREGEGIERLLEVFEKYKGEIEQIPPMYSAKKIGGQRLYKLARRGIEVKREPRKVTIYDLRLLEFWEPENKLLGFQNSGNRDSLSRENRGIQSQVSKVSFHVVCSKGTYIRQLVADIGDDLGCGAHLSKLVRTYAHPFHLSQALRIETIITLSEQGRLGDVIIPVASILTPTCS